MIFLMVIRVCLFTDHADVVLLSALGPGASNRAVVLAELAEHGVEADRRARLGLRRDLDLPAVRNKLRVGDLQGVRAGIDDPAKLLAVPLEHDDDRRRGAARSRMLATPRAVERIAFLRIR